MEPDFAKKTSINSLLNPEAASDGYSQAPMGHLTGGLGHTGAGDGYGGSYSAGPSFNLRAASWSGYDDRRKGEGVVGGQPQYRRREEEWEYGMYSDERTAVTQSQFAGGFCSTSKLIMPATYPPPENQWQASERASARIVARASSAVPDPRYGPAFYHPYPDPQPPQPDPSLVQPKRRSPLEDAQPPPKPKRPKPTPAPATTTKTPGTSKRGYPAKKRNEAAQIATQNPRLQLSFTAKQPGKGKEKASNPVSMEIVPLGPNDQGQALHAEPQSTRCMSTKYKNDPFPRCVACTRRWAGDTCRFQGIRYFLRTSDMNIVGVTFSETQKADLPSMKFPTEWNEPLTDKHILRTKSTIARALLPTLRKELNHLHLSTIIHRPRERDVRATCDTCMTSIFSTSWLCRLCGREACEDCFATVTELTSEDTTMTPRELQELHTKREKHQCANPFFLQCTKRVEHKAQDFSPMSRFCEAELDQAIKEMDALVLAEEAPASGFQHPQPQMQNNSHYQYGWQNGPHHHHHPQAGPSLRDPYAYTAPAAPQTPYIPPPLTTPFFLPQNASPKSLRVPSHVMRRFRASDLTPSTFPALWALGEPLVVEGLLDAFRIAWTPEYFIDKYGTQSCLVIECQTEVNRRVTVGEFFRQFGKYEERAAAAAVEGGGGGGGQKGAGGGVWKLKDWPPSTDFRKAFPELWEDFGNAVPVPSYVRRDGVLNLASHFPDDTIAPDIGPKMYNAMATTQEAGSKGSTRLHMDMADAVNIMTYAAPASDGSQGCAAWDLFRAEDSDALRRFLAEHARTHTRALKDGKGNKDQTTANAKGPAASAASAAPLVDWTANDPIHGQQFYLDEEMRTRLFESTGVKSYRFYQRPGEAVFIPAGCAHQVANMADCIKVAVDFVSPENVERCERLTKEFREQNQCKMWKEDVLQLRTMMWFAWLSCRQQETRDEEDSED
ncbi:hypothetical protein H0H87_002199, partial [Tephrocybe sp. NHM501043]